MEETVWLESHGGELHLMVYGQYVCDFLEFKRSEGLRTVGVMADHAVENLKRILSERAAMNRPATP